MTVKVIDEKGSPVPEALVGISFSKGEYDQKKERGVSTIHEGQTDTNGVFSASDKLLHPLRYGVRKERYYRSSGEHAFKRNRETKKWDTPYATNTVVLKKIKNPISMYVKKVNVEVPVEDQPIGFDLERGDWVSPYGGGARRDFLFTFSRTPKTSAGYRATLKIDFSNQKDGIQKINAEPVSWMSLRLPHQAPESGYSTNSVYEMGYKPGSGYYGFENPDGDVNHFFRVRTILDEQGEIKESNYGKIHGPIHVAGTGRENAKIIFQYYFNPTLNDRNVEFDPDKNLFGGRNRFAP